MRLPTAIESKTRVASLRALIVNAALLVVLLAGYGLAFAQARGYETGITREELTVTGAVSVPVLHLIPAARRGSAIAVIVHGYSGSKELMLGFGLELARMGIPSYLLDLPGHGASTASFTQQTPGALDGSTLVQALAEVVSYARQHADVAQPQMIILGHSLGTSVVGQYALSQPTGALAATILISPTLHSLPSLTNPANLQVIVGENDIAGLDSLAHEIVGAGCGVAVPVSVTSYACGDPAHGTGRQLTVLSGATHITILGDSRTFALVNSWAGATSNVPTTPIDSSTRWLWIFVGFFCAILALLPLVGLLGIVVPVAQDAAAGWAQRWDEGDDGNEGNEGEDERAGPLDLNIWARLGIFALAVAGMTLFLKLWSAGADAVGASGLRTPLAWVGMPLGDYIASSLLVLALLVGLLAWLLRRRLPLPEGLRRWQPYVLGAVAFLFCYLTVGTLITASADHFLLNGPRILRMIVFVVAMGPLFLLLEGLFAEESRLRFVLAHLVAYLLIVLGTIAATSLDSSLVFLTLLLPFELFFFLLFTAIATRMQRLRYDYAVASGIFATLIFAWIVAAVFPIV